MKEKSKRVKVVYWIFGGLFLLLLLLLSVGYLWQHFYGEKWVKQYAEEMVRKESDSLYTLSIGDLSINLIAGRITVRNFELVPDTVVYQRLKKKGHVPPFLIRFRVSALKIRGLETIKAIRDKEVYVSKILIEKPEVWLMRMGLPDTIIKDTAEIRKSLSLAIPKGLNTVLLNQLRISDGQFFYTDHTKTPVSKIEIPELDLEVINFKQEKGKEYSDKIFNSDDIRIDMRGFAYNTPDSIYRLSLGSIAVSSRTSTLSLDSVVVTPLTTREEFFRKLGYQTDHFNISIAGISLQGIDIPAILLNNYLHTNLVTVKGLKANVYRDKRQPLRPGFRPSMPQEALRKLKQLILIDSIKIEDGYAMYEEQVGEEPGKIFFDKISGVITNLTTDSTIWKDRVLEINGSAMVMGKGHLQATLILPVYEKNNAFTFYGTVGSFDLTAVNPMLTKLAPAKILNGRLDKLVISPVRATDDVSRGTLEFRYSDLNVEIEKQDERTWTGIKTGVLNMAANTYVVNSNPPKNGKLKTGIILFNRDKSKGIINFLWKSVFSGIKSTVGINTKEQREVKKDRKEKEKGKEKKKKK